MLVHGHVHRGRWRSNMSSCWANHISLREGASSLSGCDVWCCVSSFTEHWGWWWNLCWGTCHWLELCLSSSSRNQWVLWPHCLLMCDKPPSSNFYEEPGSHIRIPEHSLKTLLNQTKSRLVDICLIPEWVSSSLFCSLGFLFFLTNVNNFTCFLSSPTRQNSLSYLKRFLCEPV